jgi:hypothetical protein
MGPEHPRHCHIESNPRGPDPDVPTRTQYPQGQQACDDLPVAALTDDRLKNISRLVTEGIDVAWKQRLGEFLGDSRPLECTMCSTKTRRSPITLLAGYDPFNANLLGRYLTLGILCRF